MWDCDVLFLLRILFVQFSPQPTDDREEKRKLNTFFPVWVSTWRSVYTSRRTALAEQLFWTELNVWRKRDINSSLYHHLRILLQCCSRSVCVRFVSLDSVKVAEGGLLYTIDVLSEGLFSFDNKKVVSRMNWQNQNELFVLIETGWSAQCNCESDMM